MILAEIHELWCWRKSNLDFAILTKTILRFFPRKLDFSFWWKTWFYPFGGKFNYFVSLEIFDFVVLVEKQWFCDYDGKPQLNDFNGITWSVVLVEKKSNFTVFATKNWFFGLAWKLNFFFVLFEIDFEFWRKLNFMVWRKNLILYFWQKHFRWQENNDFAILIGICFEIF